MSDQLRNNPFAGLFSDAEDFDSFLETVRSTTLSLTKEYLGNNDNDTNGNYHKEDTAMDCDVGPDLISETSKHDEKAVELNCLVEEIFLFTLSKEPISFKNGGLCRLLYLKELAIAYPESVIDMDNLEQALFERLMMDDSNSSIITCNTGKMPKYDNYFEEKIIIYLANCYVKILEKETSAPKTMKDVFNKMYNLIARNVATALKQPELYQLSQDLNLQIFMLFERSVGEPFQMVQFFTSVVNEIEIDEPEGTLLRIFTPIFDMVHKNLAQTNVLAFPKSNFALLKVFASVPRLAETLLTHSTPRDPQLGVAFANTLLGSAFNLSCLPKTPDGLYEFFDKPFSSSVQLIKNNIWTASAGLCNELHDVFLALLKQTRQQTLNWLGCCIDANTHRGRLAAFAVYSPAMYACVPDGFALNLTSVLLRLAQPFITGVDNLKILRVDPTYPAVKVEDGCDLQSRGVHMTCMAKETCLLPTEEAESRPIASNYSFVTECFYMAHRSMDIGIRVVLEHIQTVYKELVRLQNSMTEANAEGNMRLAEAIMEQMEVTAARYSSIRCALLEPTTLSLMSDLLTATSSWLVQVVLDDNNAESRTNYAPLVRRTISFPLPNYIPKTLKCVPEMLLENTANYLVLLKRFSSNVLDATPVIFGTETNSLAPVLTMLLVFMSSNQRARNPHLRARLAECLECLLPQTIESTSMSAFYKDNLFREHPHRNEIVKCLLDVFVGIEMTGESVSFEQKFNYRRPMYAVMSFLWDIPEHRTNFKQLAVDAEKNMEAVTPPLFLRFLNLLMNDAVFLLDEALTNMARLRSMQTSRENGEWENLPESERERNALHFQQIGMTARIDNILGQETIQALEYLSSEIKSIFCHPTMSDRVAAMLNYFLAHLVGPKMKNFKVKDKKEYKFKPAAIVLNICKIYIHLTESNEFCAAVSRDGRSYNPQLFQQAQDVLVRINGASLIGDLSRTAERVQKFANQQKADDEVLADVPEEFLDPIMNTLMADPVILPSSHITIDRPTIARHLLSDQSDPFNRSLLTMDMVKPDIELKTRIDQWVTEKLGRSPAGDRETLCEETAGGSN